MKRRRFNILAILSVLLMLATVVLWVRSQSVCDIADIGRGRYYLNLTTWRSYCGITIGCYMPGHTRNVVEWEVLPDTSATSALWFVPRLSHQTFTDGFNSARWNLRIPYWLLTLVLAGSALFFWRHAHPRDGLNLCQQCGYDLRATPERCPECGRPAAGRLASPNAQAYP